jgi:NADH dehydrogenase FAD-containing subunit
MQAASDPIAALATPRGESALAVIRASGAGCVGLLAPLFRGRIDLRSSRSHTLHHGALLDGGERIPTRTLVSTVPSGPNPLVAALPCRKERGRILTDPYLGVPDYPGVWALGDCAFIVDSRTGEPCPPTAQHAIREARCVGDNIVASLRGTPKRSFAFNALGKMGALGHRRCSASSSPASSPGGSGARCTS